MKHGYIYDVCGQDCYVEFYNTIVNLYHHQDPAMADSGKWSWGYYLLLFPLLIDCKTFYCEKTFLLVR